MGTHPPNASLPYLLGTGCTGGRVWKTDGLGRHSRVVLTVGGVVGEGWVAFGNGAAWRIRQRIACRLRCGWTPG